MGSLLNIHLSEVENTMNSIFPQEKLEDQKFPKQSWVSNWSVSGWHWACFSSSDGRNIPEKQNAREQKDFKEVIENKNYRVRKQTLKIVPTEYKTIFSLKYKRGHLPTFQNLNDKGIFKQSLGKRRVFLV